MIEGVSTIARSSPACGTTRARKYWLPNFSNTSSAFAGARSVDEAFVSTYTAWRPSALTIKHTPTVEHVLCHRSIAGGQPHATHDEGERHLRDDPLVRSRGRHAADRHQHRRQKNPRPSSDSFPHDFPLFRSSSGQLSFESDRSLVTELRQSDETTVTALSPFVCAFHA